MKRLVMMSFGLAVALAMAVPLLAANARGKSEITLNGKTVSVDYGRPTLHGRTIQQMLAMPSPTGKFWRLGADSSTTFVTGTTLTFGDTTVPAGTYSLWAEHVDNTHWDLVFNTQHGQWGTSHDPTKDLVKVPLHESKASDSAAMVTIKLTNEGGGGHFSVQWGDLMLATNFKAR
jgi:Protein of unknown function (DUF2911)